MDLYLANLDFRHETPGSLLELAVLGSVNERVNDAVDDRQNHVGVVQPSGEVDRVAEETEKKGNLNRRPANDVSSANDQ